MKTVYSALSLLVLFSAVRASADERFITPQLEHDWQVEYPQIKKDVDYANFLLGICDDAAFVGVVQQRFLQIDRESMALYSRGVMPVAAAGPSVPATASPRTSTPSPAGPSSPPPGFATRPASSGTDRGRTR